MNLLDLRYLLDDFICVTSTLGFNESKFFISSTILDKKTQTHMQ